MPRPRTRFEYVTQLIAWMALVLMLAFIVLVLLLANAKAVPCVNHPDMKRWAGERTVEMNSTHRWRWRNIDGRKCWYWSKEVLPHWELVWTYTEEEFNADIERLIERKFYHLQLDENGLLREREGDVD